MWNEKRATTYIFLYGTISLTKEDIRFLKLVDIEGKIISVCF